MNVSVGQQAGMVKAHILNYSLAWHLTCFFCMHVMHMYIHSWIISEQSIVFDKCSSQNRGIIVMIFKLSSPENGEYFGDFVKLAPRLL
jgi:hypothetical protein